MEGQFNQFGDRQSDGRPIGQGHTAYPVTNSDRQSGRILAGLVAALAMAAVALAQDGADRTMGAAVGERIIDAQDCFDAEDFGCTQEISNSLLDGDRSDFERFVILRLRGLAHHGQDNSAAAIADFLAAADTGIATADEEIGLRLNAGQLLIISERYEAGIAEMERAVGLGAELSPTLALLMAQAYAQAGRYADGLHYAERQLAEGPRERRNYQMLLFYYQQLADDGGQIRLISEMIERWPGEEEAWTSLVALMARSNNESGAFEANKLMYLNGMLSEEAEIVRLAQYYSYFDYPYRGAVILEREMNAGRVGRSVDNLDILANMWRQAREYDRAISVLEQIAPQGDGTDQLRLAEAYYQVFRLDDAASAFETALARGGLDRPGDAWALLGTVRYEQDDTEAAMDAFGRCEAYAHSRRVCRGWTDFIRNRMQADISNASLEIRIRTEECRNIVTDRLDGVVVTGSTDNIDADGRFTIEVPASCQPYFNAYGEQIGGHGFEAEDA